MERLVVFVKAPRPGAVKTRLAQAIGPEAAAAAYGELVQTLLNRLQGLAEVEIRFSPDNAMEEIRPWLRAGWACRGQGNGDLGQRMRRAFLNCFAEGFNRVVLIGSDCPEIDVPDLAAAWAALLEHDVVLGPARDGGYWLVGLRSDQPALFENIPWSTPAVLTATLRGCAQAGLNVRRLRELQDVDTARDWERFKQRAK